MPRAKWVAGVLTVTVLCTGVGILRSSEGAEPVAASTADALPSQVLGLSGHRRLVRQLEHAGSHASGKGARPARAGIAPLRPARPLRLRIPGLGVDVPLAADRPDGGGVSWDTDAPTPGAAGTAVVAGNGLRLAGVRRGAVVEIARADHRTAVFTVDRISPAGVINEPDRAGPGQRRARLRLISGETVVLARLTGRHRTG
ncbi:MULTISPECIES: class F sortase [unclassified Streptomyces]|uniref:class F sortase n=1 Tax=unclassified Streptomyces TaxID=2593676 RepID=UPI001BED2D75|nr:MULTISPECIES: class F sortase [unclassified Streptomyces]MBT2407970.1 class F sortase [Streptomyces sp. ISL-21]MBT2457668.1 class F sortase [Streptomyces sp. ISL-86]MBT2610535.1 class F sortase [Streptomyces sp. ISL-87]